MRSCQAMIGVPSTARRLVHFSTRPNAVPSARWVEPRRATRCQERKLQEWRLDCRGDQGTQMASVTRTVVRQVRDNRMTNKMNNPLTPLAHQPGRLPARTNNSLTPTPTANQPGRLPVRVKLRRVNANFATAYPPDGESKVWWRRLKKALGTTSSAGRRGVTLSAATGTTGTTTARSCHAGHPTGSLPPASAGATRWPQSRGAPLARPADAPAAGVEPPSLP
jgi:hypothetical protein